MPQHFVLMIMGGAFILLGLVAFFWGRSEEKSYYDAISTRTDLSEFLERTPQRPEPAALKKAGSWMAIAVGLLLLVLGIGFWLWG